MTEIIHNKICTVNRVVNDKRIIVYGCKNAQFNLISPNDICVFSARNWKSTFTGYSEQSCHVLLYSCKVVVCKTGKMGWCLTCLPLLTLDVVCLIVCHFLNVHVSTWEMCAEYEDNVAMYDNYFIWWEARYWLRAICVLLNVLKSVMKLTARW
jgi:hypothetical protein